MGSQSKRMKNELDYRGGEEGERKEHGLDKRGKARERQFVFSHGKGEGLH